MRAAYGIVILCAVLGIAAAGCNSGDKAASAPAASGPAVATAPAGAPSAQAVAEAEKIFSTRCFTCHGADGKGDGPGSVGLTPRPRDFADAQWQASVSDEYIEKIIKYGGSAVGKSPMMPPNPDLVAKPEIVAALRAHVRSFAGK
ncbi:MAG: cytochrome c [Myxococcales bacterium]|jgi:mono/diheme cytochrome c family protein|nr:cytochrome c [Myxococcales bacterium]